MISPYCKRSVKCYLKIKQKAVIRELREIMMTGAMCKKFQRLQKFQGTVWQPIIWDTVLFSVDGII